MTSADTQVRYAPRRDAENAWIIAYQNEEYYYPLSAPRASQETVVQRETHVDRSLVHDDRSTLTIDAETHLEPRA